MVAHTTDNRKSAAITLRILYSDHEKIKSLFSKHKVKNFNQLYDYLIGSGVVYLKPKIIAFLRANIDKYRDDYEKDKVKRFKGVGTKRDTSTYKEVKMWMYDSEFVIFNKFCLEEKYKKQWVFSTLMIDGFANEHPDVIELVNQCVKDQIVQNKRKLAKMAETKFVKALEPKDADKILKMLTKNYDENKFDELVHAQIIELQKKEPDKTELKEQISKLGQKLQSVRDRQMSKFVEMKAEK